MSEQKKDVHFTTELFKTPQEAEKAYQDALDAGYEPQDINVVMSEDSRKKYYNSVLVKEGSKASEGLGIGGVTGAALGGIAGAIAAIWYELSHSWFRTRNCWTYSCRPCWCRCGRYHWRFGWFINRMGNPRGQS